MAARKTFTVDARAILALGRESIKDHTTAVLELVKNSYDAGAKVVEVEIATSDAQHPKGLIRISDDGHGMTDADVSSKWLRIGYSEKRIQTHHRGRRRVGEKGVGRLSADRLGDTLELRSQAKRSAAVALCIAWNAFDMPGVDLADIEVPILESTGFLIPMTSPYDRRLKLYHHPPAPLHNSPKVSGTELRISGL